MCQRQLGYSTNFRKDWYSFMKVSNIITNPLKTEIRRAREALESVEQQAEKAMASAANEDERYEVWVEWRDLHIDPMEEEYRMLLTRYWTKRARDKFIPVPERTEDEGYWEQTGFRNRWILTDKGIFSLRSAIRQETLSSNEVFFKWAAIILGLMAVVAQFSP
jgi:hypothetical protein